MCTEPLEEGMASSETDRKREEFYGDYVNGGGFGGLVCSVVAWEFRVF